MLCPSCGIENKDTARFCASCGASMEEKIAYGDGTYAGSNPNYTFTVEHVGTRGDFDRLYESASFVAMGEFDSDLLCTLEYMFTGEKLERVATTISCFRGSCLNEAFNLGDKFPDKEYIVVSFNPREVGLVEDAFLTAEDTACVRYRDLIDELKGQPSGKASPATLAKDEMQRGNDTPLFVKQLTKPEELDALYTSDALLGIHDTTVDMSEVESTVRQCLKEWDAEDVQVTYSIFDGALLAKRYGLCDESLNNATWSVIQFSPYEKAKPWVEALLSTGTVAPYTDIVDNEIEAERQRQGQGGARATVVQDEYVCTCNVCGNTWCFTDSDIKQNKRLSRSSMLGGVMTAAMAYKGRYVASGIWADQTNKAADKITDYSKCPNCNSTNISVEYRGVSSASSKPAANSRKEATQTGSAESAAKPATNKSKIVAGALGIILGAFGAHKFYLGYTKEGIVLLGSTILSLVLMSTVPFLAVVPEIVGIIGLVEGIKYLTRSDVDFRTTYVLGQKHWF